MRVFITIAVTSILAILTACAAPPPPVPEAPSKAPAEISQEAPLKQIQVEEFDGYTVSLMNYHWEGNELVTTWRFFNDRPKKNRAISLFAYDQDGNRITSDWPIMSGPILWPGETEEKTMPWKCGPRSTEITITVREAAKWEDGKKIIPTADAYFLVTR